MRIKYEDLRPELEGYAELFESNLGIKADEIDHLLNMLKKVVNDKSEMPIKAWTNLVHVLAESILEAEQEYSALDKKADKLSTFISIIPEIGEADMEFYQLDYISAGLQGEDD